MTENHKYKEGIWHINQKNPNTAIKVIDNKTIVVPLTKEILEEIKRQIEAEKIFKAFLQVKEDDENIIGYLNLILDDYVNFLDNDNRVILTNKMEKIENSLESNNLNQLFIKNLRMNLSANDIENFYDNLEDFQKNQNFEVVLATEGRKKH